MLPKFNPFAAATPRRRFAKFQQNLHGNCVEGCLIDVRLDESLLRLGTRGLLVVEIGGCRRNPAWQRNSESVARL